MWLLDVNMPRRLTSLLRELGIESATAQSRGWDSLSNGKLLDAAAAAGFSCLLTRDRLFGESASRTLKRFREFAIVLVTLQQLRERAFLDAFRDAWHTHAMSPIPGRITSWPS
jgi:predicted nuclease of predicted toxin-antitoxin system